MRGQGLDLRREVAVVRRQQQVAVAALGERVDRLLDRDVDDPAFGRPHRGREFRRRLLNRGQLVILESTTYPGTTNQVLKPILEKTGLVAGKDFFLGFSPEREDPGNAEYETTTIPKVVSGDGEEGSELVALFYGSFIKKVVRVSSNDTAEAVKITENVFRAVNIALVNELKIIYDAMGIDVWEVIEAAATKPFGYMPFYPGPGLGGHCIPIDPFYLTWLARKYSMTTRFIELAGEVNARMPEYVVMRLMEFLNELGKPIRGSRICLLGQSYGGRVVPAALHLLGGGCLNSQDRDPYVRLASLRPDLQLRGVIVGGATDHDWLDPGQRLDHALLGCQAFLNLYNRRDEALTLYPLLIRSGHRHAIGRIGLTNRDFEKLGPLAARYAEFDVHDVLQREHTLLDAVASPVIASKLSPYVWNPNPPPERPVQTPTPERRIER